MSENTYTMLDCLDPIQLGFLYESLMKNAIDTGLNSPASNPYIEHAETVRQAIDGNCGWPDYIGKSQELARSLADYDGTMGWCGSTAAFVKWLVSFPPAIEEQFKRGVITQREFELAKTFHKMFDTMWKTFQELEAENELDNDK